MCVKPVQHHTKEHTRLRNPTVSFVCLSLSQLRPATKHNGDYFRLGQLTCLLLVFVIDEMKLVVSSICLPTVRTEVTREQNFILCGFLFCLLPNEKSSCANWVLNIFLKVALPKSCIQERLSQKVCSVFAFMHCHNHFCFLLQRIVIFIYIFSTIFNIPYFFTAGLSQGLLCSAVACSSVRKSFNSHPSIWERVLSTNSFFPSGIRVSVRTQMDKILFACRCPCAVVPCLDLKKYSHTRVF